LILSLNCPEHLNVTTFLASSIISSPVAGFRPLLSRFFLTQNFPKPLTRTSSPDESLDGFDQFQKGFYQGNCLVSGISVCLCDSANEIFFCEGRHFTYPLKMVEEKGWS
jgi:hypothetical protein